MQVTNRKRLRKDSPSFHVSRALQQVNLNNKRANYFIPERIISAKLADVIQTESEEEAMFSEMLATRSRGRVSRIFEVQGKRGLRFLEILHSNKRPYKKIIEDVKGRLASVMIIFGNSHLFDYEID